MVQETLYAQDIGLHHKGMVPLVAYMVISGKLQLIDESGETKFVGPGEVVGLTETWNHQPLPYEVRAIAGSNIVHLDRSLLRKFRKALVNPLA